MTSSSLKPASFEMRRAIADANILVLAHIYTATSALVLGALFGLLQGLSRANFIVMAPGVYYQI